MENREKPSIFNRRKLLLALTGMGALGFGVWFSSRTELSSMHPAVAALFDAKILRVDGKGYPMKPLRGQAMLINVWAPWCAPCVEELPELSRLSTSTAAKSVQFLGLGVDNANNISDFAIKHPVAFPLLVAGAAGTNVAKALGNTGGALPFTVLIDASGQPVAQKTGRVSFEEVESWLKKL